jgi:hypothetical protein
MVRQRVTSAEALARIEGVGLARRAMGRRFWRCWRRNGRGRHHEAAGRQPGGDCRAANLELACWKAARGRQGRPAVARFLAGRAANLADLAAAIVERGAGRPGQPVRDPRRAG